MNGGYICDVASCSAYLMPNIMIPKKSYHLTLNNEELFIKKVVNYHAINCMAYLSSESTFRE